MRALIDGDICVYRVGFTTNEDPVEIAYSRIDELLETILAEVKAEEFFVYLSDKTQNGFRYRLYPEYKANRVQEKPVHYEALRQHLTDNWNAVVAVGEEADDAMGIAQSWRTEDAVICSIDKDMLQIPGHHYNFVKKEFHHVSPEESVYFFYKQLLMGDASDNIGGVKGIGPKKAEKILGDVGKSEQEYFRLVWETYRKALHDEWAADGDWEWDEFKENQVLNIIEVTGQLLKIRQEEGELWKIPQEWILEVATAPDF
jgi:DNA polymerase I